MILLFFTTAFNYSFYNYLFVWLHQVLGHRIFLHNVGSFIPTHGLSSCGTWHLENAGSAVVAWGLSCSAACGNPVPDQRLNLHSFHCKAVPQTLDHQGSPLIIFEIFFWITHHVFLLSLLASFLSLFLPLFYFIFLISFLHVDGNVCEYLVMSDSLWPNEL